MPMLFVAEDTALTNEVLPAMSTVLGQWMFIMLGVNALVTITLGIFITRKLGRPILAIKRALREIGNGNLDVRLSFSQLHSRVSQLANAFLAAGIEKGERDKAEFGEIVGELNMAMHSIRTQIDLAKHSVAKAVEQPTGSEPQVLTLENVDEALNSCRSALDFFQTDSADPDFDLIDVNDENRVA